MPWRGVVEPTWLSPESLIYKHMDYSCFHTISLLLLGSALFLSLCISPTTSYLFLSVSISHLSFLVQIQILS